MEKCVKQTDAAGVPLSSDALEFPPAESESTETVSSELHCPQCERPTLRLVETFPRPAWREVFSRGSAAMLAW